MAEVPDFKNYIKRIAGSPGGDGVAPVGGEWFPLLAGNTTDGVLEGSLDIMAEGFWEIPTDFETPFGIWQRLDGNLVWTRILNIVAGAPAPGSMVWGNSLIHNPPMPSVVLCPLTKGSGSVATYTQLLLLNGIGTGNGSNVEAGDIIGGDSRAALFCYPLEPTVDA